MNTVEIKLGTLVRSNPLNSRRIRLVIIDSIAGIFRTEVDNINARTQELRHLAQTLHEHSLENDAAIVVINQVKLRNT